jgi:hypothetical protein
MPKILTCLLKYDIALRVSAALSHSMVCRVLLWLMNDPKEETPGFQL